jgi:hypothetical protein
VQHRKAIGPIQQALKFWVAELLRVWRFETSLFDILDRCVEPMPVPRVPIDGRCGNDVSVNSINPPESITIFYYGTGLNIRGKL